jgi:hypothetical protein
LICIILIHKLIPRTVEKTRGGKAAIVIGTITVILSLLAPILFACLWSWALDEDWEDIKESEMLASGFGGMTTLDRFSDKQIIEGFMGSDTENNVKYNWGPAIGWYMALIGMGFIIFTLILVLISRRRARMPMSYAWAEQPTPAPTLAAPPQEAPVSARTCTSCGKPLHHIREYGMWYCYDCLKYG